MANTIKFKIDGKECVAKEGQTLLDAATDNGVYIPYLCHMRDVIPAGSCRICNVRVNGRPMTACTTPVSEGMEVENDVQDLHDLRKAIIEVLFISGNHYCPACEKSGNCELQALAYRYLMMVPRFPYLYPVKEVDPDTPKIYIDRNRCILCKRCVRTIKTEDGKSVFAYKGRGHNLQINIDKELASQFTDEMAEKAMANCPVGSILKKEKGYYQPIGARKFDKSPIGSEVENVKQ
ncbi:MAG: (2Fe-2S)-binding protein [Bacteroidales bacterium]|nr:(2Fe-2S)-binding protein [Bacteroidales bacterium]